MLRHHALRLLSSTPSRAATFSSTKKTVQVWGSTNGLVTGAGKIGGGTISTSQTQCKVKSVTHTETSKSNFSAKFTNATGHPLLGHSALIGKMPILNGSTSYFTVNTYS